MNTDKSAALTAVAALQPIQELLDIIEPRDRVTITDFLDNQYEVRTVLPARRQIKVFRCLEELASKGMTLSDGSSGGRMEAFLGALREVLNDDDALTLFGKAFTLAFPETSKAALDRIESADVDIDVLDLFPLEEMVEALLPLLLRLPRRMMAMVSQTQTP